MNDLPLAGITVVSLEQAVAAPYATRQLADLGARVIKVERPDGGDFARGYDETVHGQSSYFVWLNRSKESITLDLKSADGLEVLGELIGSADVFVQNLGPGATERMGFGTDALTDAHPELVVCEISGYGSDGPWRTRKAYDLLVQAEAGLLSLTGSPEEVAKAGVSVADIAAGSFAYSGILAALFARATTGRGRAVRVSLFEALTEWMGSPAYYAAYGGSSPRRTGARHATIAPYGPFIAGDGGTVLLAVQNEREWGRLCTDVLGRPDLIDDPRFARNPDRVAHRGELEKIIADIVERYDADELAEQLETASIANARMSTMDQLWEHPVLAERERWREVPAPGGAIRALLPPADLAGVEPRMAAVPALGEHSDAILAELGRSRTEIDRLRSDGIV
ncbi:formyl-CoA transferase [Rhodococcus rhodochrous J3]|uniref:CoA transferase n=2 Tax=Rhodococcus rhodochrous TaxID=1829 RepID=A0AA46X1I8_RHORH|nr:CaiB/BaiF CoA-transferase family protein [Rhodococcus rhodochrous]MBF4478674.1 CoA transferase [Rhodococcus rhodochrous]MCD2100191.1 CoA transferase [Rhodococcus rhodochrous]MCD2124549.1 CoA transferase [Rhodococcus rhodochrous]MCQ4137487.1 CoA transferase [Rhodococcus rhodochrous]MDJ0021329.1 CaiB/BaiF CoA-transferase family protein [Rhodococcus rhodochrous]